MWLGTHAGLEVLRESRLALYTSLLPHVQVMEGSGAWTMPKPLPAAMGCRRAACRRACTAWSRAAAGRPLQLAAALVEGRADRQSMASR
jgi:hypothetical protein